MNIRPPTRDEQWLRQPPRRTDQPRTGSLGLRTHESISLPDFFHVGPWGLISATIVGLVLLIASAGLVGLVFNQTVREITQDALRYDVALQDDADDLRVAILDLRHSHRNILYYGPTNDRLISFQDAYAELIDEIAEMEAVGMRDPDVPQPETLRLMAQEYYALLRPALDIYHSDPSGFEAISNDGLFRLAAMERAARQIDAYAEDQADEAVDRIERASANARLVLLIVLGGLVLIGVLLILAASRVIGVVRGLYEAEQAASRQLAEALQAKSDFLADVSHELRTPLTVVRGNAEAAIALDGRGVHRDFLEEIVEETATMTRLVEDLLFLARSDVAGVPLKVAPVSIGPAFADIAERARVLVAQRHGRMTADLTAEGIIDADPSRLEQAVMALVDNAAKFSPPEGSVHLISRIERDRLIVEVIDHGPGIPEAELPRVFDRFYRAEQSGSRKRGGAGIGLSIASAIVEAHGGTITANSRLGEGTTMRVSLPLAHDLLSMPTEAGGARIRLRNGRAIAETHRK